MIMFYNHLIFIDFHKHFLESSILNYSKSYIKFDPNIKYNNFPKNEYIPKNCDILKNACV